MAAPSRSGVGVLHLKDTYPVPHYADTSRRSATRRRWTFHARHATKPASVASVVPTTCGASKHVASTALYCGSSARGVCERAFFRRPRLAKQPGIPFTTGPVSSGLGFAP